MEDSSSSISSTSSISNIFEFGNNTKNIKLNKKNKKISFSEENSIKFKNDDINNKKEIDIKPENNEKLLFNYISNDNIINSENEDFLEEDFKLNDNNKDYNFEKFNNENEVINDEVLKEDDEMNEDDEINEDDEVINDEILKEDEVTNDEILKDDEFINDEKINKEKVNNKEEINKEELLNENIKNDDIKDKKQINNNYNKYEKIVSPILKNDKDKIISPKDIQNQYKEPLPFSPPKKINNTEYISKILNPSEYQKSPDDKSNLKSTKYESSINKSVKSTISNKSDIIKSENNLNKDRNQYSKQQSFVTRNSNISKNSVYSNNSRNSNVSRQSINSNASKTSNISKQSINTNVSKISNVSKDNNSEISLSINDKERGIYKAKYYILKDKFPNMNIQIPDDSIPIEQVKEEYSKLYEYIYKKTNTEKIASEYRTYVAIAFAVIEVVLCKVFKINASGFTKFHLKRIHQYNDSLLLLGEGSVQESSVRNPISEIIVASAVNTVFFILVKYIGKYISEDTVENVVQGMLDKLNTSSSYENLDIQGLNPENVGDFVDQFMKFIPEKKEQQKSKKREIKRPTYMDD